MIIRPAHKHFNQQTLDKVVAEMEVLGAPTIRVTVEDADYQVYQAIEGTHRLLAAKQLDLEPIIVIIADDVKLEDLEGIDFDYQEGQTAAEIQSTAKGIEF